VLSVIALPRVASAQAQDEVFYYHLDAIGSVRAITDANGQVVELRDFLPFGEQWPPSAPNSDPRRFTGQEHDATTGFDYFAARYYTSLNGRFTRADDRGFSDPSQPQTLALYVYVRNNPLRYIDPTGHTVVAVVAGDVDWQWFLERLTQINVWITSTVRKIQPQIPHLCSGGGFGYGGIGAKAGPVHGEALALVEYDTRLGGAHGTLWAGGLDVPYVRHFTGGVEVMRTWRDREVHTAPIGLGGKEIPGASSFFGKGIDIAHKDIVGLAQYENGNLSAGVYGGITMGSGRAFGGGGYLTLSWAGCKEN